MTTQEAIRTMEYFDRNFGGYRPNHEAIQMAIEALEKQARLEALIDMGTEYAYRMCKEGNVDDE